MFFSWASHVQPHASFFVSLTSEKPKASEELEPRPGSEEAASEKESVPEGAMEEETMEEGTSDSNTGSETTSAQTEDAPSSEPSERKGRARAAHWEASAGGCRSTAAHWEASGPHVTLSPSKNTKNISRFKTPERSWRWVVKHQKTRGHTLNTNSTARSSMSLLLTGFQTCGRTLERIPVNMNMKLTSSEITALFSSFGSKYFN